MLKLFRRSKTRETIERLYGAIVAQARQPAFYTEFSIPDTVEGRLEMLMLHTFLVCHRLKDEAPEGRGISQEVFDAFLDDMDRTLREMGIGDLSVPKKMKKIGQGFYDRTAAYDAALAEPGEALSKALSKNIFSRYEETAVPQEHPVATDALAAYVRAAAAALAATPAAVFARGEVTFPALLTEEK